MFSSWKNKIRTAGTPGSPISPSHETFNAAIGNHLKENLMKTLLLTLASLSAILTSSALIQARQDNQEPNPQNKTRPFMRAKLVGSQSVMDGLVTENFGLIRRGAENMKMISEAVQWPVSQDKVYDHHGIEFRSQCDKLMKLADEKNLEGVHYTFLSMTTTCINCHNYVRGKFKVVRDNTDPQGPMRLIPTEWNEKSFR
jgi:hypothetical protein